LEDRCKYGGLEVYGPQNQRDLKTELLKVSPESKHLLEWSKKLFDRVRDQMENRVASFNMPPY